LTNTEIWREIQATTIALWTPRSWFKKHIWQQFELSEARYIVVIEEYRRFLYLLAVSKEPLVPPPLIDFIWDKHRKNAREIPDGGRLLLAKLPSPSAANIGLHRNPAYQRTLDLYQLEFGTVPLPKVWPTVRDLRLTQFVFLMFFADFMLLIMAGTFEFAKVWFVLPSIIFCFAAMIWLCFFSYWDAPNLD
jgi:hypothetical protein